MFRHQEWTPNVFTTSSFLENLYVSGRETREITQVGELLHCYPTNMWSRIVLVNVWVSCHDQDIDHLLDIT